jgi:HNH endonuclease
MAVSAGLAAAVTRGQVCCFCGASTGVQADHVRPRHAGGETIPVNLAPLCEPCNSAKSCYWPGHGYHPLPGYDDITAADQILDAEIMWLRRHHDEAELTEHLWRWYGQPDPARVA